MEALAVVVAQVAHPLRADLADIQTDEGSTADGSRDKHALAFGALFTVLDDDAARGCAPGPSSVEGDGPRGRGLRKWPKIGAHRLRQEELELELVCTRAVAVVIR